MSQNDKLLIEKGVPVLSKADRAKLRGEWQSQTWDDMLLSLNSFGKYIMLRPTGFGKTFTCAAACNIGAHTNKEVTKAKKLGLTLGKNDILLNNGKVLNNKRISDIHKKKVIFVYVSDILKQTFDEYDNADYTIEGKLRPTKNRKYDKEIILSQSDGKSRIHYETYASVALHWADEKYIRENLDIENVGLVIFDEVQRMGAIETAKALDVAIPLFEKLGIYYIGATATVERPTGYDVCDKYFKHVYPGTNKYTYCWGEHIYTLNDTFQTGLIIPPEYQFITDDPKRIKLYRSELRYTRESMIAELNTMDANNPERNVLLTSVKELQNAVIKNSSKIVHDTMINLYDCGSKYITDKEELPEVPKCSIPKPNNLPSYMRFIVFTPNQQALKSNAKTHDEDGAVQLFGNMVARTYKDFKEAFDRYGFRIRTTIISSANSLEKNNVKLIDNNELAKKEKEELEEAEKIEKKTAEKLRIRLKTEEEVKLGKAIVPQELVIDLIFSINMLNVGYHVDGITGLIFKRWTGSNQIFLQQLGRCLSSVSDTIPVVFDYVNALDSRGITAPLYTYDRQNKKVTENADGTTNVENKSKNKNKNRSNTFNKVKLDNKGVILPVGVDGKPINPQTINDIDAKYIIIDTKTAPVEKIVSRCNVYQERIAAKKLHNLAYEKYMNNIKIQGRELVSPAGNIIILSEVLRLAIFQVDKQVANAKEFTMNFKAFVEFLKNTSKDIYVLYDALDEYIKTKGNCERFANLTDEINSILAASKTISNPNGANIKVLIDRNKIADFKVNTEMIALLKEKRFDTSTDLIYY